MKRWLIILLATLFVLSSTAFADRWLPYAHSRVVYELNLTGSEQYPLVIHIHIDKNFYLDQISKFLPVIEETGCGNFSWLYPTFVYYSDYDQTNAKHLKILTDYNDVEINIPECNKTIEMPLDFYVELDSITGNPTTNKHYIALFQKYPYAIDNYYKVVPFFYSYAQWDVPTTAQINYSSDIVKGAYERVPFAAHGAYIHIDKDTFTTLSLICAYASVGDPFDAIHIGVSVIDQNNQTRFIDLGTIEWSGFSSPVKCFQVNEKLADVDFEYVYAYGFGVEAWVGWGGASLYYYWFIPPALTKYLIAGM